MASLIAKKKANKLYYYVVESARVDGKPRIVHQTYLGTAEKVAALVKDRTAPVPLEATALDVGLPGALWLAAQQTGVFELLQSLWPQPRSGPSTAHFLLLAAIHRICQPGPKTEVAGWYDRTILTGPLYGGLSLRRCGTFLQSDSSRRSSGTASTVSRRRSWNKPRFVFSVSGNKSSWSAAACWLTIRPIFIPMWPAPIRGTNWPSADTTSKAAITCDK